MRLIAGLLLILLGLGWLACQWPLVGAAPEPGPKTAWRRTVDGWERTTWWVSEEPLRRPAIHPTIVALLQMFLALAALLIFAGGGRQPRPKPEPAAEPHLLARSSRLGPYRFIRARVRRR